MRAEGAWLTGLFFLVTSVAAATTFAVLAPAASAQSDEVTVALSGIAFVPASITVVTGTTVNWVQDDGVAHTVTVDDNQPEDWDQIPMLPMNQAGVGNSGSHVFEALGTTKYHCEVHSNMVGEVIVVEALNSSVVVVNALDGNTFSPAGVAINVSQGVRWVNSASVDHTVTFEDSSIGDLGRIAPGEEVSFNFTKKGFFRYRCTLHSTSDFSSGMVGAVDVGNGTTTTPASIRITSPAENETVSGHVNLSGEVLHAPSVDAVEFRVGGDDNWTSANVSFGVDALVWNGTLNSTAYDDGNRSIEVRALDNGTEVATATVNVTFDNVIEEMQTPTTSGGGTPSPAAATVLLLLGGLAFVRRRRA